MPEKSGFKVKSVIQQCAVKSKYKSEVKPLAFQRLMENSYRHIDAEIKRTSKLK